MRLWHYKLIPVLPNKMLVSQWRECLAIKRQWEKGTLKHKLVSYVMDYSKEYFLNYVQLVVFYMKARGIKFNKKYYSEIFDFCDSDLDYDNRQCFVYYSKHNNRYLRQCLYNLEEKAMRGIISKEEWQKIYNEFKYFTDLWEV